MKALAFALAFLLGASVAQAQSVPDLKGTWSGKSKLLIYGTNPHNPGTPSDPATPRVRELDFTIVITGQDGRLVWGYNHSAVSATHEPVAWVIASDGKTVFGSDTDGYYQLTLTSADRLELCYTQAGTGPSKSIIAACGAFDRKK